MTAKEKLKKVLSGELSAQDIMDLPSEWDIWHEENEDHYWQTIDGGVINKTADELEAHISGKKAKNKNYVPVIINKGSRDNWEPVTRESDIPE